MYAIKDGRLDVWSPEIRLYFEPGWSYGVGRKHTAG